VKQAPLKKSRVNDRETLSKHLTLASAPLFDCNPLTRPRLAQAVQSKNWKSHS